MNEISFGHRKSTLSIKSELLIKLKSLIITRINVGQVLDQLKSNNLFTFVFKLPKYHLSFIRKISLFIRKSHYTLDVSPFSVEVLSSCRRRTTHVTMLSGRTRIHEIIKLDQSAFSCLSLPETGPSNQTSRWK